MKQNPHAIEAPRPAASAASRGWLGAIPLMLLLASGVGLAGAETSRQWLVARVEGAAAAADRLAPDAALARLGAAERACGGDCGPRALVAGGAARALIAGRLPQGTRREQVAARAAQDLSAAIAEQPANGERWAWFAVAESEQSGDDHRRRAIADLERSYRLAPFVRDLAPWRARFAGAAWQDLDGLSRQRSLDEVARLSLIDPGQAEAVELAFSDPAAGLALDQRMARRGELAH